MTTPRTEVIAVHGWGYSSSAWNSWSELFQGKADFRTFDRGYFGRSREVRWRVGQSTTGTPERSQNGGEPPSERILLLHSMAPLFLPPELITGATVVVLFGGFRHFHPDAADPSAERSREFVVRMREALRDDPWKVIESFRRRCALPARGGAIGEPGADLDPALLSGDLDRLDSEEIDFGTFRRVPKTLILHGTGDRIVPHAKGEELAQALGGPATFFSIDQAGHALPFTHTEKAMSLIAGHITPFRSL